jgi:hypothetical protein
MADISEKLEKADGKSRPWSKKFVSKAVGLMKVVLLEILSCAQDDGNIGKDDR